MINSNDLQKRIVDQRKVEELLNGYLLEGPYIGRSILIKQDKDVKRILSNKLYATKLLVENGYKITVMHDNSLAGGFDGIPKSIKIEW